VIEVSDLEPRRRRRTSPLVGDDVNPLTGRIMSIAQLQQVLRERTREHDMATNAPVMAPSDAPAMTGLPVTGFPMTGPVTVSAAVTGFPSVAGSAITTELSTGAGGLPRPCVLVVGAQSGEGCTVTALGLAEAAAHDAQVHLVEAPNGPAHRSGLSAVTHHELGLAGDGWQRGRRGDVIIDRIPAGDRVPEQWPPPAPATTLLAPSPLLVVDGGTIAGQPWWAAPARAAAIFDAVVVVCRPTPLSVAAAEAAATAVAHLCTPHSGPPSSLPIPAEDPAGRSRGPDLVVASVSGSRWRGRTAAAGGPRMTRAVTTQRVVAVPVSHRLTEGPTTDALPRAVSAAGRQIWAVLAQRLLATPASALSASSADHH
jgi:hypothetical protein